MVVFTSGYEVLFESNLGRGAEYRNVSAEESLKRGTVFLKIQDCKMEKNLNSRRNQLRKIQVSFHSTTLNLDCI